MADQATPSPAAHLKGRPTYRIFVLRHDGSIFSSEIVSADSDDEAKAIAGQMINGHGIELWERARLIGSYPPLSAKP